MPGIKVIDVSELTGFPEMMDGRVKTLHPKVHGGLLAIRGNDEHVGAMRAHDIKPIDLLVVNLYPFEATVAQGRGLRGLHREYRHRRPGHDPRRGQEPRRRDGDRRCGRLCAAARGAAGRRHAISTCAAASPPRPMPAPRPMTRRSPTGSPNRTTRPITDLSRLRRQARRGPALRRKPASVGRLLSYRRAASRRRHRASAAGQAALLQQHQRHRRGLRSGGRIRSLAHRRLRHRQACQPVRRRRGRRRWKTPIARRLRCDSDLGLRRHRGAEPHARCAGGARHHRDLHRSDRRARTRPKKRSQSSPPRRTCGCCSPAACPIRALRGLTVKIRRRAASGADPRQRGRR